MYHSFIILYVSVKGVNFIGPCSEYVVSGSDCGHIFIWDKETEEIVTFVEGDTDVVGCTIPSGKKYNVD